MNTQQQQQKQSQLRQRKQPLSTESPTSLLPQETQEEEDSKKSQVSTPLRQGSLVVALTLTLLSLFTRLYRIADADFVVWYIYLPLHYFEFSYKKK